MTTVQRAPATLEQRFLQDTASHRMTILREDGVHRHLRFMPEGRSAYWFDIITWPGTLCIDGDAGTFVFRRLTDMFDFFRPQQNGCRPAPGQTLVINPTYWAEKLESVARDGYNRFSRQRAAAGVVDLFNAWCAHHKPASDSAADLAAFEACKAGLWQRVESEVLSYAEDGKQFFAQAAVEFEHDTFTFREVLEKDLNEFTPGFLWCCYALVWGIGVYDTAKASPCNAGQPAPALIPA